MTTLFKFLIFSGSLMLISGNTNAANPPELTSLRDSWQNARKRATDPVDRKYLEALKAMKEQFVKSGKLEEALAVDAEIKKISASADDDKNADAELIQQIDDTTWQNIRGHESIMFKDKRLYWGKSVSPNNAWELIKSEKNKLTFIYRRTSYQAVLTFKEDLKEFTTTDGNRTFARITPDELLIKAKNP